MDIVVSNKGSRPLYEQIADQIKGAILAALLVVLELSLIHI